jgi:hypothetical protein
MKKIKLYWNKSMSVLDSFRDILVIMWIVSLISLGVVCYFAKEDIDKRFKESKDRGPSDSRVVW